MKRLKTEAISNEELQARSSRHWEAAGSQKPGTSDWIYNIWESARYYPVHENVKRLLDFLKQERYPEAIYFQKVLESLEKN